MHPVEPETILDVSFEAAHIFHEPHRDYVLQHTQCLLSINSYE